MRKEKKEFTVYEYNELSEKAKDKAFYKWYEAQDFFWSAEYKDTLKKFCYHFDINVYNWSVDIHTYDFDFIIDNDEYESVNNEKSKSRVNRFIINKFNEVNTENCFFTGYCADIDILDCLKKSREYEILYSSYKEFIQDSLDVFFMAWRKDIEYSLSRECFEENYCNEDEYLENGDVFSK